MIVIVVVRVVAAAAAAISPHFLSELEDEVSPSSCQFHRLDHSAYIPEPKVHYPSTRMWFGIQIGIHNKRHIRICVHTRIYTLMHVPSHGDTHPGILVRVPEGA